MVVHVLPGATLCLSHATACSNIVEGQKIIFLAQVMATFSGFHLDLFLSLYESDCAFSTDFKKNFSYKNCMHMFCSTVNTIGIKLFIDM